MASPAARRVLVGTGAIAAVLVSLNIGVALFAVLDVLLDEVELAVSLGLSASGLFLALIVVWLVARMRPEDPTRRAWAPPLAAIIGAFVLVLFAGELAMSSHSGGAAALVFVLGAALPPLAALVYAVRQLDAPLAWRQLLPTLLFGALASGWVAVALEVTLPALVLLLVRPAQELVDDLLRTGTLRELYYSPALLVMFVEMAIVAPVAEEFAKPLAVLVFARRLQDRRHAALLAMAAGSGFAILENMLYEGVWSSHWLAVTAARGIGGPLHPLGAGLVGLALFDAWQGRPGGRRSLVGAYATAVLLHMAWNGGLVVLYSRLGEELVGGAGRVSVLGIRDDAATVAYLVVIAVLLWRTMSRFLARLRDETVDAQTAPLLAFADARRLSLFAVAVLVLSLMLGATWGPTIALQVQRSLT